jgi:hypothetical protein
MSRRSLPCITQQQQMSLLRTKRFCSTLKLLVKNASSGLPGDYSERAIASLEELPSMLGYVSFEEIRELQRCREEISREGNREIHTKLDEITQRLANMVAN